MKKKLMILLAIISMISFSTFIEDISKIDELAKKKDYENAYKLALEISKKDLETSDRLVLDSIIQELKSKNTSQIENVSEPSSNDVKIPNVEQAKKVNFDKIKNEYLVAKNSNNSELIYQTAQKFAYLELFETAMNLALSDNNKDVRNLYLAATTARLIGEYNKSIELYDQILLLNPEHYKSYLGLAMNYKIKGDFYNASQYLKKYLEYNNSPEIENEIKRLESLR